MSEVSLFIKYNGESESYKKHRIDAKQLSVTLSNLADLIYESNTIVNGVDSYIDVKAQAGFVKGSFGLELIVNQDAIEGIRAILPYLGLVGGMVGGSLISTLSRLKGKSPIDVVIDERANKASIVVDDEETIEAPAEVVELMNSPAIRKRLSRIIEEPLDVEGTDSFQVLSSADEDAEPLLVVAKEERVSFKSIRSKRASETSETETVASIEFITSNKDSGTSGWKIRHLGIDVPVKVKDDVFLESLKRESAPSIYGTRFSVDLHVKRNIHTDKPESKTYTILKVRSAVRA